MKKIEILCQKALESGAFEVAAIPTQNVKVYQEVRDICKKNTCRKYGTTWACPPAVGTIEECIEKVKKFDTMILFTGKYELEDSFDYEGMVEGMHKFKLLAEKFEKTFGEEISEYLLFSNEGCHKCEKCTYPDAPCRFPDRLHPSLEGFGFIVSELAKMGNIHYINGANTVTYFGALCVNSDK